MAKSKVVFVCKECTYESPKWMGKCPECDNWNTFEERSVQPKKASNKSGVRVFESSATIKKLSEVVATNSDRIVTSINEFNRVMGGGIVRDSITIITAKPGAGKSTLLLQVASDISSNGMKVLYASGEESDSQIRNRAGRILKVINDNIWVISTTSMDSVVSAVNEIDPDLIIVDSIQTFTLDEYLPSRAGSPTQTMECASELLRIAKDRIRPRAVFLVGQMNKNEEIAGLRSLEHLVDTVLVIEGDSDEELRSLIATKNRFGSTGEMGFFSMTEEGMMSIDNPSEFFMTKREEGCEAVGTALTAIREGSRPIILEIESLVSNSFMPYPSRICESIGRDQLNTLISILEQRGYMNMANKNVVLKTTGGLRLREAAINLCTIMSIASSIKEVAISSDTVFISDVGLTGELKKVPSLEARLKEVDRMGFKKAYIAKGSILRKIKFSSLKVIECKNLMEVIQDVFNG
ncbi:DNA repair protein RadA [Clostridium cylindrosporum]|uniref:DNA repair protein RadA n=1 Tax=Clostridium cylindrosporum DSM 605 TaxID=1121307 RepID=A0A0J8D995_CLOCY|nr:DNA repair protein RadA [Clostridium cylindrosporum]KMT22432.1 DNA repair protein RadA [Clostridium cylindrosporum DSM 605]